MSLSVTNYKDQSVLFQIKESQLETGLRGFPVGFTVTSSVDPHKGLHYRGHSIIDLSKKSLYEVLFLLYEGSFGTKEQLMSFKHKWNHKLPERIQKFVESIPNKQDVMGTLCSILMKLRSKGDIQEDANYLISYMPQIVSLILEPKLKKSVSLKQFDYVEPVISVFEPNSNKRKQMMAALKIFCLLHLDHGGGNLSTFVSKAVASGGCNLFKSIACGIAALSGPLHGGANKDSIDFISEIEKRYKSIPKEKQIRSYVEMKLKNREKIPGFGHAVLRCEDPRATVLYNYAKSHFPNSKSVKIALVLRDIVPMVLKQYPKIKNPYPNVDAISGVVLKAAGLVKDTKVLPLYFALARTLGIVRQIIYERCEARGGKGVPIYRPKYTYKKV